VPADAPPSRVPLVELEWKQFEEDSAAWRSPAACGREHREALESMVRDRRTDLTLEQIERSVSEEEDIWWND